MAEQLNGLQRIICTWRLPRRRWSMFNLPKDSKRHFYCRREISSPVSAFVSVRLCRLSSLHFNFYTFLNQDRCSRRRDFLSFTSSSLKSATYITDDAVCSSTQSPSTHVLWFCSIVHTSYSTRRVSEAGDRVQWFCWLSILSLFNLNISVCVVL